MAEFTQEIAVAPSFDHRFDPEKWRRGCGSMHITFTLGGPLGFITTSINTGWMFEPLVERPSGFGGVPRGPWGNEVRERGKVGPDCISRGWERPMAGPIVSHAAAPPGGKEWQTESTGCELIEGGICYGDIGYLVGNTFLARLASGGSDSGFDYLREIHDDWLAAEVPA